MLYICNHIIVLRFFKHSIKFIMHSVALNHLLIFALHTASSVILFTLIPNDDSANVKDPMKATLGYDVLTLKGSCPVNASAFDAGCELTRTLTHETTFEGIDIILLFAVNELITALSHLIGFAGWYMSEASWKADMRHLELIRRQLEYGETKNSIYIYRNRTEDSRSL